MQTDAGRADPSDHRDAWLLGFVVCGIIGLSLGPAIYWDVRAAWLRASGTSGIARVVKLEDTGSRFNEDPVVEFTLELEMDGMPPGPRGTLKDALSPVILPRYQPGARVKVWFDPEDPSRMAFEAE